MGKVLVLGGEGMLGQMVVHILSRTGPFSVEYTSRSQRSGYFYDAEEGPGGLQHILELHGPFAYLINCIGVTSNKINERDPTSLRRAILVNALFPYSLASLAQKTDAKVIHISTDGVFSGDADYPYLEDAPHDSVDIYGKTKSLGEVRSPRVLNIRCSIIGPDSVGKRGLLEWFLAQPENTKLAGYTDHLWNGVTTVQFAELCQKIIIEDAFCRTRDESPVHHFCPNRPLSKYELLEIFKSVFRKTVTIEPSRSPSGALKRILATRYQSLAMLYGCDLSMEHAVHDLVALEVIDHLAGIQSKSP